MKTVDLKTNIKPVSLDIFYLYLLCIDYLVSICFEGKKQLTFENHHCIQYITKAYSRNG